jgi:flavin-binding protein dodecin
MTDRTYRVIQVVGTSPEGIDEAIRQGIAEVAKTTRHLDWVEVEQIRGQIDGDEVVHYQASLRIGFRLED